MSGKVVNVAAALWAYSRDRRGDMRGWERKRGGVGQGEESGLGEMGESRGREVDVSSSGVARC